MKRITKQNLAALMLCALFLSAVAYVSADSAIGSVTVTDEIARIVDITFPLSAVPTTPESLDFRLEYGQGWHGGDQVWVHLFSAGATPDLSCSGEPSTLNDYDHYATVWFNSYNGGWEGSGVTWRSKQISNYRGPDKTTLPIEDNRDIPLGFDVTFDQLADATNPWTVWIQLRYKNPDPDLSDIKITETVEFDLADYLQVNIIQSTFDFGSIEQGQVMIPIANPTMGLLNISVTSNSEYRLQVSGTDPSGNGNSFSVGYIYQNAINDTASAVPLTGSAADIANLGLQAIGDHEHVLFLWITIPATAPTGTYTFTLTVTILSV